MPIRVDDLVHFGNLDFLAKKAVEGFITGLHKSPYNGFSVEFAEHSQYNIGDSTRHIDWKVFGRTDKLYLKNYEDETNLRCQIVVDASSSMYYPTESKAKIKFSCLATASLCYLIQKQRDAVGYLSFSDQIETSTPLKSSKLHLYKIFSSLETLMNQESKLQKTSLIDALHTVAYKLKRRGLVIIFSDMIENSKDWEAIFPALQHLKFQKHEIVIFNTVHKKTELDFFFEDKPHIFKDLETGKELKVNPMQVREAYLENAEKRQKEIYLKCSQYKIDLIDVDVDKPIEQVLQGYMIKRSKLL
jgi:uncharacterized protein (DUF58 family)